LSTFFINPDPYYTPRISIGPFSLRDVSLKEREVDLGTLKVLGQNLAFAHSGKKAIEIALETLNLGKSSIIGIVTTSGNSYVSKCVTETISKYCDWVIFDFTQKVDCLFVIHEFGCLVDFASMNELRKQKIPIINDFAYSFLSLFMSGRKDFEDEINLTSFPKSFNINFGGLIHLPLSKKKIDDQEIKKQILNNLGYQLDSLALYENISQRMQNREFYGEQLKRYSYEVIWDAGEICPGVCMITPKKHVDLQLLKSFLQRNGVESSVFYGKNAFFVPVHNLLTKRELEYVCYMIGAFDNAN
jgi:hypothetical protein